MDVHGRRGVVRDLRTLFVSGSLGGLGDVQLLERYIGRNDEGAFEALMSRHGPMVWGVCKRLLRNHQDAEDAFQATFLVLARKAPSIHPRDLLANWLYGVAYRTASKARSTRTRRDARERTVNELPEPFVVSRVVHHELSDQLDRELTRLPDKYRVPIILCDLEEKSHKDAALLLGWPIGTVSGRISRGRTLLAKRLRRDALTPSASVLTFLLTQNAVVTSLPYRLIESTSQAAGVIALGRSAALGMVSTQVAVLTEGVLKSMFMTKIKIATAVAVSGLALFAGGTGIGLMAKAGPGPGQDPGSSVVVPKPASDDPSISVPLTNPLLAGGQDEPEPARPPIGNVDPVSSDPNIPRPASSDGRLSEPIRGKSAASPASDSHRMVEVSAAEWRELADRRLAKKSRSSSNVALPLTPNDEFKLGEITIQGTARNKLPSVDVAGILFGPENDAIEEVEFAIAQGVMEAEQAAKGKTPQEIHQTAEEVAAKLKEERLHIRALEAFLRRLVRIRDKMTKAEPTAATDNRDNVGKPSESRVFGR